MIKKEVLNIFDEILKDILNDNQFSYKLYADRFNTIINIYLNGQCMEINKDYTMNKSGTITFKTR